LFHKLDSRGSGLAGSAAGLGADIKKTCTAARGLFSHTPRGPRGAVSDQAAAVRNALIDHRQELILQPAMSRSIAPLLNRRLPVSPERRSAAVYVQILARFFGGLRGRAGDRDGRP
jgi:hypothetical protein